jgi:hypothetical protein
MSGVWVEANHAWGSFTGITGKTGLSIPEASSLRKFGPWYADQADFHLLPFGGDLCRKPTSPS